MNLQANIEGGIRVGALRENLGQHIFLACVPRHFSSSI